MSMQLSVYVGPYMVVERSDQTRRLVEEFERVVCDGRMEAADGDDKLYLIPNTQLPGVERQTCFGRDFPYSVGEIHESDIVLEMAAFREITREFRQQLQGLLIAWDFKWGYVCCYS
jgi:hypothetical protein